MSKTSLLFGWENLRTLEARVDSRFWYDLADQFRRCDEAGEVSANIYRIVPGLPYPPWTPSPISYTTARSQFERLALQAWSGVQLPVDPHNQGGGIYFNKLVGAWLDIVWSCVLLPRTLLGSNQQDGVDCAWTIHRVSEASAIVCTRLANQARDAELTDRAKGDERNSRQAKDARKTPKELLDAVRRQQYPKLSKERFAERMGIERSVFFDLQAGRPVSEETYRKAAAVAGIPIDDLKPTSITIKPTD